MENDEIPEKLRKCFGVSHDCLVRCGRYEVEKCSWYYKCQAIVAAKCKAQSERFDRMKEHIPLIALRCEYCGSEIKTSASGLYCACTVMHLPHKWFTGLDPTGYTNNGRVK
jgi:hypothetical protein